MKNDKLTFDEFHESVSKSVKKYIFTIARYNNDFADDIFQDTMLNAYKNFEKLKSKEKMHLWVFAIAKKEASRYFYKNKLNIENVNYKLSDQEINQIEETSNFISEIISEDNLVSWLNKLDMTSQQILTLIYAYDMSQKEISKVLHIKYNTVRSLHARALKKIEKFIKNEEQND